MPLPQSQEPFVSQADLFDQAFNWEPKYSNRFIMVMDYIPSFIIKAASRPSFTNGEIVMDHINIKRKLKGKTSWNDITITCYDPITPSGAQRVMDWARMHHEANTGRDGYSSQYKEDLEFYSLSPLGEKIEKWKVYGAWIGDATFGSMDWSTEDAVTIELTLKYDYALLY